MKRLLMVMTVAAAGLIAPTTRADDPADVKSADVKPAVVPFEMLKSQHMAVQVKVNGKGPFRLIFDTGAPFTLISNKVAREANVFPENFKPSPFALFGMQQKPYRLKELEMGELKLANVDAMVMDHPTVGALASVVGPIEGIIGFNVFAKHRTTIDYQAKAMTFVPVKYEPINMIDKLMRIMLAPPKERSQPKVLAPAGLLGIRVEKAKEDENAGVTIAEVFADSPAAEAGLKPGDRLLTLAGRWTDSVEDCYFAASRLQVGIAADAEIIRDGTKQKIKITIRPGT
ncbi:MAG: aspartyl protease family protein [Gemmataceae bacterium]|nr:aspartyl protease family protein [Gemmataceae bacterium]